VTLSFDRVVFAVHEAAEQAGTRSIRRAVRPVRRLITSLALAVGRSERNRAGDRDVDDAARRLQGSAVAPATPEVRPACG
jgi:hypothetical protein